MYFLQKDMQGVETPFIHLATEFVKLYDEKKEYFKTLA